MIQTKKLDVGYKDILISNINFTVAPGQIVTIIGPNGSGKSTVLKTILKQLEKKGGSISICEKEIDSLKEKEYAKQVSMVTSQRLQPERMTCEEMVATARYPYTGRLGILSENDWQVVYRALEQVNATSLSDKDFNEISDGERQRIMLARAIAQDTEIIVLDEPTSYLDMHYKLDLLKIIHRLAKQEGKTILMSLHELDLVKSIADTIVCVNGKEVVKVGTSEDVYKGSFIQNLYGIEDDEFETHTGRMKLKLAEKTAFSKHVIMVQGTMSSAGKSFIVAGLCRLFKQYGYKVAPFKSQNMALNSYITKEGKEMGRAQVMQAEAAGIEADVCMNPILLKPTSDVGSQVIVNGEVLENMPAKSYFQYKTQLIPEILKAYHKLEEMVDIIVIEGAGSPAEINLKQNDIVNMGMAQMVNAPVLLVADIDRGGVFAQLYGTVELLEEQERNRIQGLIINKFRGDKSILDPGIEMLEEKVHIPVIGTIPYSHVSLDEEDSVTTRFDQKEENVINLGVVRFPRISNFTDFAIFEQMDHVSVHYMSNPHQIDKMDCVLLPGSKNTIADLKWLKESGFEVNIKRASKNIPVIGICGGYQMLGNQIQDPYSVEEGGYIEGLGLLDINTVLEKEKITKQVEGSFPKVEGPLACLSNQIYRGYEIHMGNSTGKEPLINQGNVYGSYVHGLFDAGNIASLIVQTLAKRKGISLEEKEFDYQAWKESQYDLLAQILEENMDVKKLFEIVGVEWHEKEN